MSTPSRTLQRDRRDAARGGASAVGVAIATRDRRERLLSTVARLRLLPDQPAVVVADNGSRDGSVAALQEVFGADPGVRVLDLGANRGSAARTDAVRALRTPLVAFSDDDSWWEPGALLHAAALFDAHPRLGLLAAKILVGPERRLDPTCAAMAASPLGRLEPDGPGVPDGATARSPQDRFAPSGPGVPVLGFVACGAIVRREAFLQAGGFHPRYGVGGEERLLALDLAAAGWQVRYDPAVVACHWPRVGAGDGRERRAATAVRNDLWTTWLRRPARRVPAATARTLAAAGDASAALRGSVAAVQGLPWVLRARRPLPEQVERAAALLERS